MAKVELCIPEHSDIVRDAFSSCLHTKDVTVSSQLELPTKIDYIQNLCLHPAVL